MVKYFAHINSKRELIGIDISTFIEDEYHNDDVLNIEVDIDMYNNSINKGIEYYIYKDNKIILNPNYNNIELDNKKKELLEYNDTIRDKYINNGIIYKGVKFDSDTDQKINLLGKLTTLNDGENIVWYGMDNDELLCNKQDLINIGTIIEDHHTYCWTHNSEIKLQIKQATSLEELNNIEIKYGSDEE